MGRRWHIFDPRGAAAKLVGHQTGQNGDTARDRRLDHFADRVVDVTVFESITGRDARGVGWYGKSGSSAKLEDRSP